MPKVRYSNKAVEDMSSIWEYTFASKINLNFANLLQNESKAEVMKQLAPIYSSPLQYR